MYVRFLRTLVASLQAEILPTMASGDAFSILHISPLWTCLTPSTCNFDPAQRQNTAPTLSSFPYRALEHYVIEEPPRSPISSEADFEAAIANQDTSITLESHTSHWKDVYYHWVMYFEQRHALEDNRELLASVMPVNGLE